MQTEGKVKFKKITSKQLLLGNNFSKTPEFLVQRIENARLGCKNYRFYSSQEKSLTIAG